MLSTDLVPVHNIWRKLPFLFLKGFQTMNTHFEEGKKVTRTVSLTLTQMCFSALLPPAWTSAEPWIFSYALPPFHWSNTHILDLTGCLDYSIGTGLLNIGSMSASNYLSQITLWNTATLNICLPLTFTPRTVKWRTPIPQTWGKPKYKTSLMGATKRSSACRTVGAVVKVCI